MHKNYTLNILAKLGGTRYMTFDLKLVFVFELQCIIKILKRWKTTWYAFRGTTNEKKWLLPLTWQNFPGPPCNSKVMISILKCLLNPYNVSLCQNFQIQFPKITVCQTNVELLEPPLGTARLTLLLIFYVSSINETKAIIFA